MGFSSNRKGVSIGEQSLPGGGTLPPVEVPGQGTDWRKVLGLVSDGILAFNGKEAIYGPAMAKTRQQEQQNEQAIRLARIKAESPAEDPSIIRALRAAGIDPTSPEGRKIITDNLSTPRYMTLGTPETGQVVINPNAMPGGGGGYAPMQGPPAEAVSMLKASPNLAAQFDETFGPGAAARVLGGGM